MRVLKSVQPAKYKKFTTARDDDFHFNGHACFAGHILYYPPVLKPIARHLGRQQILEHPVKFESTCYDEHVYLALLTGLVFLEWLKATRNDDNLLDLLDPQVVQDAFEAVPGPLAVFRFTLDVALPLAAAKESVWDNVYEDAEMFYTSTYHMMRATGKTNEAALIVHHKIDHMCSQDAYQQYLRDTRSIAWTKNKHIERGRMNEFVNKDGKQYMRGKMLKASTIRDYYATYDASAHIKRTLLAHVNKMNEEREDDTEYLKRYAHDLVSLLALFFEKFGDTWQAATRPTPINTLTNRRSGNEPWRHVQAIGEGRRHIGDAKNRMTWQQHCQKHTAVHARM